jgi:hypothetical protein
VAGILKCCEAVRVMRMEKMMKILFIFEYIIIIDYLLLFQLRSNMGIVVEGSIILPYLLGKELVIKLVGWNWKLWDVTFLWDYALFYWVIIFI